MWNDHELCFPLAELYEGRIALSDFLARGGNNRLSLGRVAGVAILPISTLGRGSSTAGWVMVESISPIRVNNSTGCVAG